MSYVLPSDLYIVEFDVEFIQSPIAQLVRPFVGFQSQAELRKKGCSHLEKICNKDYHSLC